MDSINKNDEFLNSKNVTFLKEFLKKQNVEKIAFATLEDINTTYLQKLKDFLINENNINTTINLVTSQYNLEEFRNVEFTLLFISLDYSSCSKIESLSRRLGFLNIKVR